MLTKLEKFKKLFSFVFFFITALIFIPAIFYTNSRLVQVISAFILLFHFIIAVIYFIKGISTAAMCMVYYLLLGIGIAIVLLLNQCIQLPSFLDPHILNTIGIIIPIIFTVSIPLPQIVRKRIIDRLECREQKITGDEIIAKSLGIQTRDISEVDYTAFINYKKTMIYTLSPYSLVNASPTTRLLRILLGGLFLILGVAGLLIGPNIAGTLVSFPYSLAFWVTASSLLSLATGIMILLVGFIRAFICSVALVLLGILYRYVFVILQNLLAVSILLYCLMAACIVVATGFSLRLLIRFILKKQQQALTVYPQDDSIYAVDLFLEDFCPIIDYSKCLCARIQFDDSVNITDFDHFNDDLLLYCSNKKMILAGIILNEQEQIYAVYIYFRSQKQGNEATGFLQRKIKFSMETAIKEDPEWDIYKTALMPSDSTLIRMHNQEFIRELKEEQFDFSEEASFILTAIFEKKEDAFKFKQSMEKLDYEKIIYEDNSESAKENDIMKQYYYQVHVQKNMKISEAWLNIETLKFDQLAKDAGGKYEFMYLGELDEHSESDLR